VIVLLANNTQKKTYFTLNERIDQLKRVIDSENLSNRIIVDCFDGLLVSYCKEKEIKIIIRGLRPLVDFEYEFEMAMANRELGGDIETIFILTDPEYFYLRSSMIKDVISLGGDVLKKIPEAIRSEVFSRLKNRK
jgi:pantetheine-phosphate adenylyltransferase